jgi:iron only hydrogenase large subunit-like protein
VKFIVISLSVQPVLSLAERYKLTPEDAVLKLSSYFKSMGADMVLDMTIADDFSLIESAKEFVDRYKLSKEGVSHKLPMLACSCPGLVFYKILTLFFLLFNPHFKFLYFLQSF